MVTLDSQSVLAKFIYDLNEVPYDSQRQMPNPTLVQN